MMITMMANKGGTGDKSKVQMSEQTSRLFSVFSLAQRFLFRPPDIVVGGLRFYRDYYSSSSSFPSFLFVKSTIF